MVWVYALWGALGQLARSFIGLKKAVQRGENISLKYWIITIILGACLGAIAGMVSHGVTENATWLVSFLSGYSAVDMIEGLVKKY